MDINFGRNRGREPFLLTQRMIPKKCLPDLYREIGKKPFR